MREHGSLNSEAGERLRSSGGRGDRSGGGQRSRLFFRVLLALTVAAELQNEDAALPVIRSFGSDRGLAFTAEDGALFHI